MILPVVAVALLREDGHILMQRRPEGKQHGGLWEFPGGKIDPGEGPIEAAQREMEEELGVGLEARALMPVSFAHSDEGRRVLLLLYIARVWSGDPVAREGQQFAWVAPDALSDLDMPPLDVPLVRDLLRWIGAGAIQRK
ncbi:8-oxo-dGTP diphosphatase [Novosphingobium sp. SG751A]|uniref:(deoxy)nucleoside triphosphate pyrophosphohydrolase n=1 Tax=Novosphingobium sp. SG751A TaxID=2587000 RepID=UPI001551FB0C|nr:(deoxy)nucleoside triphosphate pyrophosphohydrolase [Novosphingobium sp. SG751A]NOW47022.1 8-oxo-dGTP diphosphatase [Novosphingobium sp. SG751A]